MKKFIIFISILIFILSACSTPEGRKTMADEVGTVIYQKFPDNEDLKDMFITHDDNILKIVYVSSGADIYKIVTIDLKNKLKHNKKNVEDM